MTSHSQVIEQTLSQADRTWRLLRLLQHSATLGVAVLLAFLGLGAAMYFGKLTSGVAQALIALLLVGAFCTWIILAMVVLGRSAAREWLADALERRHPQLLDRLNTLVFLERHRRQPAAGSFYPRIAAQTQAILAQTSASAPMPKRRALLHIMAFLVLLAATIFLHERFAPWERMIAAQQARKAAAQAKAEKKPEPPLELPAPQVTQVEQTQPWGEVRITEPARDLKVTKVDVVPLQVEAAANEPLKAVAWLDTVNGTKEQRHELPPPAEPRYAVYQPTLYLDEMQLADWDVLTYYAQASTENSRGFASDVYFLEVRPFREDILKLPGGESGQAYQYLSELTSLIERQQHVIRETHQHVQNTPAQSNLEEQDRQKLAAAETDLAASARHLYAQMASEMENKPIGDALDQLAKADDEITSASKALTEERLPDAQTRERSGLAALVAARKIFQQSVSEHPDQFKEPDRPEPPPIADSADKLQTIAEFRDEAKAAQDFVQNAVKKQQDLSRRVSSVVKTNYPALAREEDKLQQSLKDFTSQHPKVFSDLEAEAEKSRQSLQKATESLQKQSTSARSDARQAAEELQRLQKSLEEKAAEQQLADAYKLKQLLDRQIETFGQCQTAPGNFSAENLGQTIEQSRQTLKALKNTAERAPTRDAFTQPLRDALSDPSMPGLEAPLNELAQAQDDAAKSAAAGKAKEGLSKVSQAFNTSQPKALQAASKNDALKPEPGEDLDLGIARLEKILRRPETHPMDREQQGKQGREALYNLQTGMKEQYGSNERGNQILLAVEKELKPGEDRPLDAAQLQKLLDQLRQFSLEIPNRLAKKDAPAETTNIDPARLPPAYRGRIEKYFQKLSEQ